MGNSGLHASWVSYSGRGHVHLVPQRPDQVDLMNTLPLITFIPTSFHTSYFYLASHRKGFQLVLGIT